MLKAGQPLTKLHGIGPDLAGKIQEIVETGRLKQLDEIENHTPPEMVHLLKIGGLGPRRVQALYELLGVKKLKDLRQAAESGKIREIPGFGEKIEQNILADLQKHAPDDHEQR